MKEIYAYIYGKKIGTLLQKGNTIYFEYDPDFRSLGVEISPFKLSTAKTHGVYTNKENFSLYGGMAGVFFDSLPDKHGMPFIEKYFERQGLKTNEITLLHKLAFIGDLGMGALEYLPQEYEDSKNVQQVFNAKDAYETMKHDLDDENCSIESLMNIINSVSPVGGGRPKMLVQFNKTTKAIKLNSQQLSQGYKRAILKFDEVYYGDETIGLTKLEYIFMGMAKEAGIDTAEFELIKEGGQHHLVVERFDRDSKDEKIHMCSASGLMHIDISVAQVTSYENLLNLTRMLCKSQADVEELYKRMVFNILAFNFDDHTKNFSYLMDREGRWHLSPAYDITYSKGMAKEHLTTLRGKGKDFTKDDLLKVAQQQSISKQKALAIISEIIEVMGNFGQRAVEIGLDKQTILECKKDIEHQISLLA